MTVPGMGVPYEEPLNLEVAVDSEKTSEECADNVLGKIDYIFYPKRLTGQVFLSGGMNLLSL